MTDCVLRKIVWEQIPSPWVHEDELTLAFMDIGQVNPEDVVTFSDRRFGMGPTDQQTRELVAFPRRL